MVLVLHFYTFWETRELGNHNNRHFTHNTYLISPLNTVLEYLTVLPVFLLSGHAEVCVR